MWSATRRTRPLSSLFTYPSECRKGECRRERVRTELLSPPVLPALLDTTKRVDLARLGHADGREADPGFGVLRGDAESFSEEEVALFGCQGVEAGERGQMEGRESNRESKGESV